ncbi:uncharacterized protein CMU_009660 [Cryptosporidium muris RN66]|uniref:Transcription factor IIIC subunit 5 HTH domain-containing protein n=1 Tax=Cryptosporidium muris (strain RN66) TaxID=441375 RepID=B6AE33_CRYMR|nr:uncharacterized protein CMU_009660 [Cryptosporidium muris RN66]EEA06474.1 hypothetical protein, conserved [Cryptosporidium muris RN66]|eukprot:XP_002140823.1 hypothetical protein [Cryptosporidium muris RN66]
MTIHTVTSTSSYFHIGIKYPQCGIVAIEIPGQINNPENAIKALGGLDDIKQSIKDKVPIKLTFCDEDPFSRTINSSIIYRTGLLYRKLRYKNGRVEIIPYGLVKVLHRYNQMADYYFIPPEGYRIKRTIQDEIDENRTDAVFIPPAIFSKVVTPVSIRWMNPNLQNEDEEVQEDYTSPQNNYEASTDIDTLKRSEGYQYWNVVSRYSDEVVPSTPLKISSSIKIDQDTLKKLKYLFDKQPLWLRPVIESELPTNISAWKRKLLYTQVCYNISDGPWRACLCRLGYDPRKDNSSRMYQTVDFRDPYLRGLMKEKRVGKSMKNDEEESEETVMDWQFKIPPTRASQLYQLCNIADDHIQEMLNKAIPLKECTRESGWFQKSTIEQVRQLLSLKCKQMRQVFKE